MTWCLTPHSAANAPRSGADPARRHPVRGMEDEMAFEDIKAAIDVLMDEIVKKPEDSQVLAEQLREKIAELRALGLPVPADLKQFEDELTSDNGGQDPFDNMPV